MIRREFDALSSDELMALAVSSTEVRVGRFPAVEWDRTHVVQHDSGAWTLYCVYDSPDAQQILDYSAAADLPVNEVIPIAMEMQPQDTAAVSQ
jgi:hypothetical protein